MMDIILFILTGTALISVLCGFMHAIIFFVDIWVNIFVLFLFIFQFIGKEIYKLIKNLKKKNNNE